MLTSLQLPIETERVAARLPRLNHNQPKTWDPFSGEMTSHPHSQYRACIPAPLGAATHNGLAGGGRYRPHYVPQDISLKLMKKSMGKTTGACKIRTFTCFYICMYLYIYYHQLISIIIITNANEAPV